MAILFLLFTANTLQAQQKSVTGMVVDSLTHEPVIGATVVLQPGGKTDVTDDHGTFRFQHLSDTIRQIIVSAVGYEKSRCEWITGSEPLNVSLRRQQTTLANVVISANEKKPYKTVAETDIALRGVANSQEVLRMVPGLFIGQHQGGGKAEQIFLRGFDADHGTDINIQADGIPVNLVSHAHAQGYADSHFIIPETIERVVFNKGPYDADKGDGATTGNLDFLTANRIAGNTIKLEGGQFQTGRALAMMNLLRTKAASKVAWYWATEYNYSNSYFDHPQHFKRFNYFTKFNYRLSASQTLTASASTFWSRWNASGQIPERAIDSGWVTYYGALDPNEGGTTVRTNVNLQLSSFLRNGDQVKNQLYYSRYGIDLHSNFSFFLVDTADGDEIRQREKRNLLGYNGSWTGVRYLGILKSITQMGVNMRFDATNGTELSHTVNRNDLLKREKLGDITQLGTGLYISENLQLSKNWQVQGGLRFDHFYYRYGNHFTGDTSFSGTGNYTARNHRFSPKLNIRYQAAANTQIYLSLGKGFHTNDARVVVKEGGSKTLPSANGADLGILCKPIPNLFLQAATWYIYLQQEYVYAGDGGTVEFNGRTWRLGFDVSARYQPLKCLYIDVDANFAHGRSVDDEKGRDYIPLAPVWSSSGGVSLVNAIGWNGSFRYRYLSSRPANADYSLTCPGYFVNDLVVKYKRTKFEYGLIINNLLNVKWKETVFETETKFKQDPVGINGLCFTPGTRFDARVSIAFFFGNKTVLKNNKQNDSL